MSDRDNPVYTGSTVLYSVTCGIGASGIGDPLISGHQKFPSIPHAPIPEVSLYFGLKEVSPNLTEKYINQNITSQTVIPSSISFETLNQLIKRRYF